MADLNSTTVQSVCRKCALFTFCETADRSLVSSRKTLHRKELLYTYHDSFHFIYAISSGAIKTFQVDLEGQERIHQFYYCGELLGFDAIHTQYHPFSATAVAPSQVCRIPYSELLALISKNPSLYEKLLSLVSQRFHFGLNLMSNSAEQRIACFLLELINRLHLQSEALGFELLMSRQDIAHYLGLATETISRVFTRLQQNQLISIVNKRIKILDLAGIQWIAQKGVRDSSDY